MKKYIVKYSSNNSGGRWWLRDGDWEKLEKAGWIVEWYKDKKSNRFESYEGGRFLGARATEASIGIEAGSAIEAITAGIWKWEKDTCQNASSEGCNCCGAPHSFTVRNEEGGERDYASGEDVLRFLYEDIPSSLRDALEIMGRKMR
jgi:hypothetical protein